MKINEMQWKAKKIYANQRFREYTAVIAQKGTISLDLSQNRKFCIAKKQYSLILVAKERIPAAKSKIFKILGRKILKSPGKF